MDSLNNETENCIHFFDVDRQNIGLCRKCGKRVNFGYLQQLYIGGPSRYAIEKEKMLKNANKGKAIKKAKKKLMLRILPKVRS